MLAETPVTQHSPYYSAVSASLTNPLPDCSNYSPFCHTHYLIRWPDEYFTSLMGQTLYQAESSQELMSSEEYRWCLEEAEQQAEASGDVPPPLQIVISTLFSLHLYPLSAPFLNRLSSSFPHFPASPPSFLSLLINSLSS